MVSDPLNVVSELIIIEVDCAVIGFRIDGRKQVLDEVVVEDLVVGVLQGFAVHVEAAAVDGIAFALGWSQGAEPAFKLRQVAGRVALFLRELPDFRWIADPHEPPLEAAVLHRGEDCLSCMLRSEFVVGDSVAMADGRLLVSSDDLVQTVRLQYGRNFARPLGVVGPVRKRHHGSIRFGGGKFRSTRQYAGKRSVQDALRVRFRKESECSAEVGWGCGCATWDVWGVFM